jgi:hypothetical protein
MKLGNNVPYSRTVLQQNSVQILQPYHKFENPYMIKHLHIYMCIYCINLFIFHDIVIHNTLRMQAHMPASSGQFMLSKKQEMY